MLTVRREAFIPSRYRDYAYEEVPLPLPGERATISSPHSHPLVYEPLGLGGRDRFLEVGVGSGYGTALAREVVGPEGLVVAIDIDATTLTFARERLEGAGYTDVVLVHGDGGLGYPQRAPYDRICITAACPAVPPPLIEQLAMQARLIAPVIDGTRQRLRLLEKAVDGIRRTVIADVLYVSLQGGFGVGSNGLSRRIGEGCANARDRRARSTPQARTVPRWSARSKRGDVMPSHRRVTRRRGGAAARSSLG